MDPFEGMTINPFVDQQQRELEMMRRQERYEMQLRRQQMERFDGRQYVPQPYRYDDDYYLNSSNYAVARRPGTVIVCPVCASDRCSWWEEQIVRDNAGEILKDMLRGVFKGEQYYDRGGGYREQEEYYQRMRQQFEQMRMPPKPEPTPKTEDAAYDVVSTEIKGKPKKQIPYPIFSENK